MNINEKRALLRQKQKAVGAKISRIKANSGVKVAKTEFDPRKGKDISRMRSRDIDRQLAKYDAFLDRGNQFVGDANNRPIPIAEWRTYKMYENRYNKNITNAFNQVKNVQLPNTDETIDNRMARRAGNFRGMATDGADTPYKPRKIDSRQVVSRSAVDRLTRAMKKQASFDYLPRRDRINRQNVLSKMIQLGKKKLIDRLKALPDKQFRTMFLFSGFGESFSQVSGTLNDLEAKDELDDAGMQMYNTAIAGMESYIEWAEELKV